MFPRRSGNARLHASGSRGPRPPGGGSGGAFAPPRKQGRLGGKAPQFCTSPKQLKSVCSGLAGTMELTAEKEKSTDWTNQAIDGGPPLGTPLIPANDYHARKRFKNDRRAYIRRSVMSGRKV